MKDNYKKKRKPDENKIIELKSELKMDAEQTGLKAEIQIDNEDSLTGEETKQKLDRDKIIEHETKFKMQDKHIESKPDDKLAKEDSSPEYEKFEPLIEKSTKETIAKNELEITDEKSQLNFVDNSGLVLISSFLPKLFERLDLLEKDNFKNSLSRERAVKVLQYLITEKNEVREYDIALNKIICGMDINQTIEKEFEATKKEKENCRSLLISVIEHWSILKNTTVEGFRESFLKRRGKLEENEEQWILRVEPKAFDMLIDQIPWSYSILKFKWMNKPVYVEWR